MKTIAFYNHKGGVGKTTITAAIAGELICEGKRVIILDTDSQANLSSLFSKEKAEFELADYLFNFHETDILQKIIQPTNYDNLYIMPSRKLSNKGRIDDWARTCAGTKEYRNTIPNLIKSLAAMKFDYVLIDMPPSYTQLDQDILLSSDEVIPVLKIDIFSVDGISDFYQLLLKLKDGDEKPVLRKYIFNCKDLRTSLQRSILEQISKMDNFKKYIIPTDSIFEKSKATKKLIQAMNGTKKETQDAISQITKDIIAE